MDMVNDNKTDAEIAEFFHRKINGIHYAMRKYGILRKNIIPDLENEIWKDIHGYEGYYQISNLGRVKSVPRWIYYSDGRKYYYQSVLLELNTDHGGYRTVVLTINTNLTTYKVHRLVAEAFIPNPDNLPQVNHKDENKSNNRVDNLEWCDMDYNNHYGTRIERVNNTKAIKNIRLVIFTNTNTGEQLYFLTVKKGSDALGIDNSSVYKCLNKKPGHKTVKGYSVEYAEHKI